MKTLGAMIGLALAATAGAGDGTTRIDAMIHEAIETYHPPHSPPPGQLRDLVVVIHPAGGGSRDPKQRRLDDLSLLTAGHLYHLIRQAGGVPKLTRADDRPMPGAEHGIGPSLARACRDGRCHLLVSIDFVPPQAPGRRAGVTALGDDDLSVGLVEALEQVMPSMARQSASVPQVQIPAAKVTLREPDPSLPPYRRMAFPRDRAITIYKGLAGFVAAARDKLEKRRAERWPDVAASQKEDPVPRYPSNAPSRKVVSAARRVWPNGRLPVNKAAWFAGIFRRTALSDRTVVYFEPQVTIEDGTVVIRGATNVAYLRDLLPGALRAVGIETVRNEMRVLPEEGRLGLQRFGACVAPMALTFSRPSESAGLQTQILYGEPLLLLDRDAGYYLVHAGDGYWGWVRRDAVRLMTLEQFRDYTASNDAVLLVDLELDDRRILRGSRLPVVSSNDDTLTLMHPDGSTFEVAATDARIIDESAGKDEQLRAALAMLYTPYLFGGKSPLGMDCSGMVCNVSEQAGVATARDAAQQFLAGKLVATRWYRDGIRPGDRLYFIDARGKIFHTGIAISPTHFVHCSAPEVQISSLKKGDRLYAAHWDRAFLAAKRP